MPKMQNRIVINAPIEKVWAYLDDVNNAPSGAATSSTRN